MSEIGKIKNRAVDLPSIYGFNECSEAGDNVFAAAIFLFGCNLRCPYCMNAKVVVKNSNFGDIPTIPIDEIREKVDASGSEWVMISGGEPTTVPFLHNLVNEIKSWGYKVGISTNGTLPDVLDKIIDDLDYVTMDLKSSRNKDYEDIGLSKAFSKIIHSKVLLNRAKSDRDDFDYEIRTTLYPPIVDEEVLNEMGNIFSGDEKWILQPFRQAKNMIGREAYEETPYTHEEVEHLLEIAQKYTLNACIKYV